VGAGPDALTAAIDEAWRVFDLPAPATIGVCTDCCMKPVLAAEMLATSARDLTEHHLSEWHYAAYATGIGRPHLAWLLPRMFELLAEGKDVCGIGPQVLLARLPLTGFPGQWPEGEVEAVRRFCLAFFDQKIATCDPEIDSWLCMMASGGLDICPFLDRLWALSDADLAALLYANWIEPWREGWITFTAFWQNVPACNQVWTFYTSSDLATRLFRAGAETDLRLLELAELVQAHEGSPPPP
jgi:hypothetical protein